MGELWRRLRKARGALCLASMLATGCTATGPASVLDSGITRADLLAGVPELEARPAAAAVQVDLLAVNDAMRAFLGRYVDSGASERTRLNQLLYALVNKGTLGLEYNEQTLTAPEVFERRAGNCLSFTTLFVALARELGLRARYQQVQVPPSWNQQGTMLVLNRHINVLVELGRPRGGTTLSQVVDFNNIDYRPGYAREPVDDDRALAHYHSNQGVDAMRAGNYPLAFAELRAGLTADAGFAPLWINLGALYSRLQYPARAESAYLQALRHDRDNEVALSNLSRLYERLGHVELSTRYAERVRYHRMRNPYYRHFLAREAYLEGDYSAARRHVLAAIDGEDGEDSFYFLLGQVLLQSGDRAGAREALERAMAITEDDTLRRSYEAELRTLSPATD